ncbi:acyl-CoA dehydrogenase C-terminal domain-containing protein [Sphingobium lignivorans]|uniref:Alkylation response protein AidB-like acyl-CoA dehydrogenase n=1 Tax=Sphingobium lignivorans TaxID=2735886 RepID=A0ABR6NDL7_9SPHN|nr:acyl-CoA dehydrogenase C-terminal domain-containing protein [Sphingobium lignivorans]MBB5985367.1 alkylation response protein AidB-like acyl-CoA dehydrogenase [Sphingobium lignivorans]
MPSYTAPVADTLFVLDEIVGLDRLANVPGFAAASSDIVQAVLEEGGKFAAEVLYPLNAVGDQIGCTRNEDGTVTVPPGFKEAFDQFVAGGWTTLHAPEAFGGQDLPMVLAIAVEEFFTAANHAFNMYHGLTGAAVSAILAKGSEELQQKYVPNMVAGTWCGTMNLTEPHCGTDLGLIKSRAEPQADGSYRITGTKIFISGGEHSMAENIIHLVLAKTPGAPAGSKGISLFLVPKFMVGEDGTLGAHNAVSCGSIEHKMGIHGNATCVMNYDGATGWMIGEENKGLAAMFIMMNQARLGVGVQGLAQAEVAYQQAVRYAMDRRQGRALTGPAEPDQPADTLFVHPDVRRMLMEGKALTEGLRALLLWGALQVDLAKLAPTEEERQAADDLISLLTPVIKGYGTDKGFDVAVLAQQVFGGHGYIQEWGVEQNVRDARIAMIYEGTNGVQAMDLVGRKLPKDGGRAIQAFFRIVGEDVAAGKAVPETAAIAEALEKANQQLQAATMWLMQNAMTNPNNAGAAAYAYMHIMGIVSVGLMWLRMARAAQAKIAAGAENGDYLNAKLVTARYFAERIMPEAGALRRKIEGGAEALMALPPEAFLTAA